MSRRLICWCVLTVLTVGAWGAPARAQNDALRPDIQPDPEAIAKRCIEMVERITERCVEANEATAKRCIRAIEKALEEGNVERARRIARLCIRLIDRRTHACLTRIGRLCRHCVSVLERMGADELAERVKAHCSDAAEKVRKSRARAVEAILDALGDVDPGPVPTPTDPASLRAALR